MENTVSNSANSAPSQPDPYGTRNLLPSARASGLRRPTSFLVNVSQNPKTRAKSCKLAIVAGEWAKRKKMGEDAVQHCRGYALEAERKMGQMLAKSEKAIGGAQKGVGRRGKQCGTHDGPHSIQTLNELGISKNESASAQMLASLPDEDFEKIKDGKKSKAKANLSAGGRVIH